MTARIPPRVPARVPARVVESLTSDLVQTSSTSLHAAFLCAVSQPLFCTALLSLSSLSLSFVVVLSSFDLLLSSLCIIPLVFFVLSLSRLLSSRVLRIVVVVHRSTSHFRYGCRPSVDFTVHSFLILVAVVHRSTSHFSHLCCYRPSVDLTLLHRDSSFIIRSCLRYRADSFGVVLSLHLVIVFTSVSSSLSLLS
jgi:hypothetical protein